jgi:hypothetical protein
VNLEQPTINDARVRTPLRANFNMIILKYLSYYQIPDYDRRWKHSLYTNLAIFKYILHILKYVLYNRIFGFYSSRATFYFQRVNDFPVLDIYFMSIFHFSKTNLKKMLKKVIVTIMVRIQIFLF